jgi:hypothetical protein
MKNQQAVTGRPLWQVSLMASIQRGQKRLKRGWARVFKAVRPVLTTSALTSVAVPAYKSHYCWETPNPRLAHEYLYLR